MSRTALAIGILMAGWHVSSNPALAQDDTADDSKANQEDLKGSTETTIQTIDGVYLNLHYWIPEKAEDPKETPIVILLHARGRSQRDWFPFAKFLSENGVAACTFDFRGHGQSRDINPEVYVGVSAAMKVASQRQFEGISRPVVPRGERDAILAARERAGQTLPSLERIDQADEFKTGAELAFAMPKDLEAVKDFLLLKHNEGIINIQRLGIIGAEMGGEIGLIWMLLDEYPVGRQRGWVEVGGDLSAVVLMSPSTSLDGFRVPTDFNADGNDVPIMIVSGNDRKKATDAERLARKLRVPERSLTADADAKTRVRGKTRPSSGMFVVDSTLVGTDLLRPPVANLDRYIGGFLKDTLTRDKSRNWQRREVQPDRTGFGTTSDKP